jgi:glycosyltransferase involved in cell wall biosynthesis
VLKKPFFSIIMPLYNKAPHVKRVIDSVLLQSSVDFELIVVDDASTDGGDQIVNLYHDKRIKIYRRSEPGAGGYAARNHGLKYASGVWATFLDADDYWFPDHLMNLKKLNQKYPSAEILSAAWFIGNEVKKSLNPFARKRNVDCLISPMDYLAIHAEGLDIIHTNVVAIKMDKLNEVGAFPEHALNCKRAGDGQTWLRVVLSGAFIAWTPEPGAIYYQDAVNMVTKLKKYHISENCLISFLNMVIQDDKYPDYTRLLKRYRNRRVVSILFQDLKDGSVNWEHLCLAKKYFIFDLRLMALILAYFAPWLGRFVFSYKEKTTTI